MIGKGSTRDVKKFHKSDCIRKHERKYFHIIVPLFITGLTLIMLSTTKNKQNENHDAINKTTPEDPGIFQRGSEVMCIASPTCVRLLAALEFGLLAPC